MFLVLQDFCNFTPDFQALLCYYLWIEIDLMGDLWKLKRHMTRLFLVHSSNIGFRETFRYDFKIRFDTAQYRELSCSFAYERTFGILIEYKLQSCFHCLFLMKCTKRTSRVNHSSLNTTLPLRKFRFLPNHRGSCAWQLTSNRALYIGRIS